MENGNGQAVVAEPEVKAPEKSKAELLKEKLEQDLVRAQEQQKAVIKRLDELQKEEQLLVKQKIALDTLIGYVGNALSM